jgi:hypothetical protein
VGLSATVVDGRLTRLGGGSGEVSATLSMGGRTLAERTAPFDAQRSVALGRGIALMSDDGVAPAPSVVETDGPGPQTTHLSPLG